MNNKINRLHEKCLRIVYSDKTLSFKELLDQGGRVTIHTTNLQVYLRLKCLKFIRTCPQLL